MLATVAKTRVADGLGEARSGLAAVDGRIADIEDQLKTWVRLAAFLGLLFCVWGLWAQLALARWGWRTARPEAGVRGEDPDTAPTAGGRPVGDVTGSSASDDDEAGVGDSVHAFVIEPARGSAGEPSALSVLTEQLMGRSNGTITVNVNVAVEDRSSGPTEQ